jgi:hypothetical protein
MPKPANADRDLANWKAMLAKHAVIPDPVQYVAGPIPRDLMTAYESGVFDMAAVTWVDKSGTVASGGSYTTAIAANDSRMAWFVKNPGSATEDLTVRIGGSGGPVFTLPPGAAYSEDPSFASRQIVAVTAATTGHAFEAGEAT